MSMETGNHTKWVVKLSSRTLSSAEKEALDRGLKYAPAPSKIPTAHSGSSGKWPAMSPRGVGQASKDLDHVAIAKARPHMPLRKTTV